MGLILAFTPLSAEARVVHHHHKIHKSSGGLVDRGASYADIVVDAETGQVLHATNPDSLRHPASLTKMMTLYVTFQTIEAGKIGLNDEMPISSNAAEQSPSKLGLRAGQTIRVEDAILGLVTESANDAAVVLAEYLGGSEEGFGAIMTKQAHALGMTHSRFDNPSGLPDPDQVTTARDMALLGHALIYHFPRFYPYFSRDSFTYAGLYHHNHNHLMDRYDGMDGIKTGYIRASGFNLVASAKRGNVRLIGVVFGGHSATARDNRMAELLDEAFADDTGHGHSDMHLASAAPSVVTMPEPQGDSADSDDANYVKLPAKTPVAKNRTVVVASAASSSTAKPAQMAAKPSVVVNPDSQWGIQIGAYGDPAVGQAALANLVANMPQYLANADPVIQKVSSGGMTVYRARLMSLDEHTAEAACAYLMKQGQGCITVNP